VAAVLSIARSCFVKKRKKKRPWKYNPDESGSKVIILWLPVSWIMPWINHGDVRIYAPSRGGGPKNHSRSRIKKRGEKRGKNSIYAAFPYFSICYVYTFPRRGLTRFFFWNPVHFRARFPALYRTGYANEKKGDAYDSGHTWMPKASNISAYFAS